MTELDLFSIVAVAAVAGITLAGGRQDRSPSGSLEHRLTVAIPHGEILVAVRTPSPIAPAQWRKLRAAASNLAGPLRGDDVLDPRSLDVHALGPLQVYRNGMLVTGWGGPKAGSRQALALFALLLDRADRGVHRDEVLELIWPEVDMQRADLAFHRTLGGLRTVLGQPPAGSRSDVIVVRDGMYRLNMALVRSLDVDRFEEHLSVVESTADLPRMEAHLEAARRLYRGDYMDDCPYFGDSAHVETRRQLLRDRFVGALRLVADARERSGRISAASQLIREAMAIGGGSTDEGPGPHLAHPAA